jgi:integrase
MSVHTIALKPGPTGMPRTSYRVYWREPGGHQRSKSFRDSGDAAAFDTQLALNRDRLRYGSGDAPSTFGAVAARWLAVKAATKRESTVTFYESTLRNHVLPTFAHTPIAAITRADVQDWINAFDAKGLAPNTIRQIYRAVFKAIIALALDDELIFRTPCRRIELRAAAKAELHPLTPAQVTAMAAAVRPRYRAMVILAAGTGMRWSEIAGLTRDRIDWVARTVKVDRQVKRNAKTPTFTPPKTKAGIRTLPLPNLVVAELLLHLSQYPTGPAGLLFTTPAGGVLNQSNWRRREWNRARTWAYGVPRDVTFHRLRHTYASLLIDADVHPKALQVGYPSADAAGCRDRAFVE